MPHAHILLSCMDKIQPNAIDCIICAEITDSTIDPELFEIITKNMIHGTCGALNKHSPCMIDGKCSKRFSTRYIFKTFVFICVPIQLKNIKICMNKYTYYIKISLKSHQNIFQIYYAILYS